MTRLIAMVVLASALWASAAGAAPVSLGAPVGTLALPGKAHGVHLVSTLAGRTLAYIATENGMAIADVTTPNSPFLVGNLPPSAALRSEAVVVSASGDYAYLASPPTGLIVVDVRTPSLPRVVATRRTYYGLWDVTVKDHVIYGVSFAGEMYLFDIEGTRAAAPLQIKVLGLPGWGSAGGDTINLAKLRSGTTTGNAKATGVSVSGNYVFAVDWGYGRLYAWDASDPEHPVFAGTHYAPYLLKAVAVNNVVYMLSAYGPASGIYTVPISLLDPYISTRHATCAQCRFLKSLSAVDQGGLEAVPGGSRIVWGGGKGVGELHVVNVETPTMVYEVNDDLGGAHAVSLAGTVGLAPMGDYLIVTAGLLGLQVYLAPMLAP